MTTSARIQLRRDTAANWTSANPTLAAGEPAVETDTGFHKIGDGVTAWASLAYVPVASSQLPASVVKASSWTDLCAAPYNHVSGDDVTTDLQALITAANTANQDATIYFSKPGTYQVNGALQTGTALGYTYNGQILLPARAGTTQAISIRIMGLTPPPVGNAGPNTEPVASGGVILKTNLATAGWMFDAIPASSVSTFNYTNIRLSFQDITLRSAAVNPPNGMVNGTSMSSVRFYSAVVIDTPSYYSQVTPPTSGVPAVIMPPYDNSAMIHQSGQMAILGYGIGLQHSEHFVMDNMMIEACAVAVQPTSNVGGSGQNAHGAQYRRLLIQGCPIGIQPIGGITIDGMIDIGDSAGWPAAFNITSIINDGSNFLFGTLRIHSWQQTAAPGFPVIGAQNVNLIPLKNRATNWPRDNFNRLATNITYPYTVSAKSLGATSETHHVWRSTQGAMVLTTATSGVKQSGASTSSQYVVYAAGRGQPNRIVRMVVTTGTVHGLVLCASRVISGANAGNMLIAFIQSGVVTLYYQASGGATTSIAASGAGAVLNSTAYTFDFVISNPIGGSYTVAFFINGVSAVSGTLSGAEVANLVDTDLFNTQDGFQFFNDTGSVVSTFAVMPT